MSVFIPNTFVTKFGADIIREYQRMGAALRPFARTVRLNSAEQFWFPTGGRIDAVEKGGRHSDIIINNTGHDRVLCPTKPYYAADAVDDVDQLLTNQSIQQFYREMIVAGLGRKEDDIQIQAMAANNTPLATAPSATLSTAIVEEANRTLSLADVPRDNMRIALISPYQTSQLLAAAAASGGFEVINRDVRGEAGIASNQEGRVIGRWRSLMWVEHTGLPELAAGADTQIFFFHAPAVGKVIVKDIEVRVGEIFQKDEVLVRGKLVMGSTVVRPEAVLSYQASNS